MSSQHENEHPEAQDEAPTAKSPTGLSSMSDDGRPEQEHRVNGHRRAGHGRHLQEDDEEEGEEEDEDGEEEDDEDEDEDGDEEEEEEEEDDEEPALKYDRITGAIPDLLKKDSASALAISHSLMVCPHPSSVTSIRLTRIGTWNACGHYSPLGPHRKTHQVIQTTLCIHHRYISRHQR